MLGKEGPDLSLTMITGSKGGLETLGTYKDQFRDGEKEDPQEQGWSRHMRSTGFVAGTLHPLAFSHFID